MNGQMPTLLTGFGEINFGTQYRQGYRVYDGRKIAMSLCSNPVGGVAGYTYLYLVEVKNDNRIHGEHRDE